MKQPPNIMKIAKFDQLNIDRMQIPIPKIMIPHTMMEGRTTIKLLKPYTSSAF